MAGLELIIRDVFLAGWFGLRGSFLVKQRRRVQRADESAGFQFLITVATMIRINLFPFVFLYNLEYVYSIRAESDPTIIYW